MEYRREIALVYSIEEATQKLNIIRGHGFSEFEIHLFAKDILPLQSLKMYTDLQIHQAGNLVDQILSVVMQQNVYEVCLRNMKLSREEIVHYGHGIEQGAIFIIAQHDHPYEKEPKTQKAAWNISNAVD
ncbi:hypothetical protein DCE79_10875 [Lysinibacillus sp. 2017]|uniref:general stress protein n=1 Tax=Lysinibacillus sp. S2017 TaxID=2561923 RepID=UPI000D52A771|nr:general stress protein [Lysinibacillus sp. S2017]AWE07859.1 hypothetical protein DCE79_10875 [Lysinibacillus sp. 2017]TGN29931.1 hypothetical protein E4L99_17725 [Lysinibacillus sp. S2017]